MTDDQFRTLARVLGSIGRTDPFAPASVEPLHDHAVTQLLQRGLLERAAEPPRHVRLTWAGLTAFQQAVKDISTEQAAKNRTRYPR